MTDSEHDDTLQNLGNQQQSEANTELTLPSWVKNAKDACYFNADSHLNAAHILLDSENSSAAYHHGVIALEEVGKAELLTMNWLAQSRSKRGYRSWMDDHLKKLFWSLWGPSFGQELITMEQIQSYQGFAKSIHETRLGSLYVDIAGEEPTIIVIDREQALSLIKLTQTRLEMSKLHHGDDFSVERKGILKWFLDAPDDPDKRKFIFSGTSQKKLIELGDIWEWVKWLHDESEQSEKIALEMVQKELDRQTLDESEQDNPKWRLRIRLHCPSHSIRKSELRKWNEDNDWIKLESVDRSRHELIVDMTLRKNLPIQALWHAGLGVVRWFISALNIGTFGFFWFTKAEYTGTFYESVIDLENNAEVHVERSPKLEFDWGNHALKSDLLARVSTCLVGLPNPQERKLHEPFNWYLTGIACLAKTDVHVPMVVDAFRGFYFAWKKAMIQYGEIDIDADAPKILGDQIAEMFPKEHEDQKNYVDLCKGIEKGLPDHDKITLNEVGCMKVLCDFRLQQILRKSAEEKINLQNSEE